MAKDRGNYEDLTSTYRGIVRVPLRGAARGDLERVLNARIAAEVYQQERARVAIRR